MTGRPVVCSRGKTLDGYAAGPDGGFGWGAPEPELFRTIVEDVRRVGAHLLGRRLDETMPHRETDRHGPGERELASLWGPLRPSGVLALRYSVVR